MTKRFLFALTTPQSATRAGVETTIRNALKSAGITPFMVALVENGVYAMDSDPWCIVTHVEAPASPKTYSETEWRVLSGCVDTLSNSFEAMQKARDEWRSEFNAAQAALTEALRERDTARDSLRTVTAERDRLRANPVRVFISDPDAQSNLAELRARAARYSETRAALVKAHAQAFDDITELRASAKRYSETRAALTKAYGEGTGEEWRAAVDANQAALLSLQVLREKLRT